MRYAVRGLVASVVACVVVATWATRLVLSPGSGTFYGLLVYLPILAAPGFLAWRRPAPRVLALWSAVGWIASIAHQLLGQPYRHERALDDFSYVQTPMLIAMGLVLLVTPLLAFIVAAHARRHAEPSPDDAVLARRLRRIVQLCIALGAVAIATALVPTRYTASADSVFVAIYVILLLAPAMLVWRDPRRRWAWLWSAWALPFAALGTLMSINLVALPTSWTIATAAVGTMNVLLLLVMPVVCLTTRTTADRVPAARVR